MTQRDIFGVYCTNFPLIYSYPNVHTHRNRRQWHPYISDLEAHGPVSAILRMHVPPSDAVAHFFSRPRCTPGRAFMVAIQRVTLGNAFADKPSPSTTA